MSNEYGDLTPRNQIHAAAKFLENGIPYVVTEPFVQSDSIPRNASDTMVWRRYLPLDPTPAVMTENVTPNASQIDFEDVQATLTQYFGGIQLSDKIADMHEDPVLQRGLKLLGQQGAEMAELINLGAFIGGSQVFRANGNVRTDINSTLTLPLQRNIVRLLERNRAKPFTEVIRSSTKYGTQNIPKSYIAWCHPDLTPVIEDLAGFKHPVDYGTLSPFHNEIGAVGPVRYLKTDLMPTWQNAGAAVPNPAMISTGGANCDIYPILYVARDALGAVALKGMEIRNNDGKMEPVVPVSIMVTNAKPSDSDPWAQRTWATYKFYKAATILQDLWLVRAEVAVPA